MLCRCLDYGRSVLFLLQAHRDSTVVGRWWSEGIWGNVCFQEWGGGKKNKIGINLVNPYWISQRITSTLLVDERGTIFQGSLTGHVLILFFFPRPIPLENRRAHRTVFAHIKTPIHQDLKLSANAFLTDGRLMKAWLRMHCITCFQLSSFNVH